MEDGSEYRCWDELIPDALGLIFRNLSLQEILTVVPRVCKSWNRAVSGPYCWQEIDIEEWSNKRQPHHIDRMLRMLIARSCGSLRKLCVSGIPSDAIFPFLADHAGSLQTLRTPRSEISDSIVEQIAGRLSTITFLDVSHCNEISARALEAIGKNCKLLSGLCRNVELSSSANQLLQDDEAQAIASTMPKLKHLEVAYHLLINTESVLKILSSCPELEFLNLTGCWDVKFDRNFLQEKFPKLKVVGPHLLDYYDMNDWGDYCSEYSDAYSDASEYFAWEIFSGDMEDYDDDDDDDSYDGMWDDEQRLEELELRFYEGNEDAGLYGWPLSP
ncbi:F-box protein FBW2 [Ricinus communis]|uniref:Ubiquitin-protein ligase, putative n=1 Tax=Ricinus communis TaxID=3988 RepID=B9RJN1_RICCO|nr:F-box protein FBW2 [Ricinus communis]XP_015571570.1 F-box protein FBW2 [Ricinus communis]XP_048226719.1 F-box protein FBW2 [Ricinus communis]EEF48533.1 ubiquitin-protein ligase, putative [Ricinus communis]|eukprot:XP_002513950.1 F-box protein FBW2 isoform X2 [Ricinus communis]